jgi:hypothetical protein
MFEFSFTSTFFRYEEVEKSQFVGSTNCRKLPITLCATTACTFVEGPEECHNKTQVPSSKLTSFKDFEKFTF